MEMYFSMLFWRCGLAKLIIVTALCHDCPKEKTSLVILWKKIEVLAWNQTWGVFVVTIAVYMLHVSTNLMVWTFICHHGSMRKQKLLQKSYCVRKITANKSCNSMASIEFLSNDLLPIIIFVIRQPWQLASMFLALFVTGHKSSIPLPCAVGWQSLLSRWAADLDVSAVSHVCALYTLCFHPGASLLCSPGGLPCPLPPGGKRTWQVRFGCTVWSMWVTYGSVISRVWQACKLYNKTFSYLPCL